MAPTKSRRSPRHACIYLRSFRAERLISRGTNSGKLRLYIVKARERNYSDLAGIEAVLIRNMRSAAASEPFERRCFAERIAIEMRAFFKF